MNEDQTRSVPMTADMVLAARLGHAPVGKDRKKSRPRAKTDRERRYERAAHRRRMAERRSA